jgi:hypothetical protein
MVDSFRNFTDYQFSILEEYNVKGLPYLRRNSRNLRRLLMTFILLNAIAITLVWHYLFSKHFEEFDWVITLNVK